MNERKQDEDEAALRARLERLDKALRAHDEREAAQNERVGASGGAGLGRAISAGLNVFAEFVSAVIVGALIGWQGDVWLGTRPWLLVLFLGLGTAAGFWNIYRMAARKGSSEPKT
jgi:ATP synthase protein I